MRSRRERRPVLLAAILAAWCAVTAFAASPGTANTRAIGEAPGVEAVSRAIEVVKADPNLATERTIKTLRWKSAGERKTTRRFPSWLLWIGGLVRWLEQTARYLVWGAAALLAGLLVVYILRVLRVVGLPHRDEPFKAPTHVQDLDIRPESLPADIGAAARALWDDGDRRASLALLYRGLLSRLVHVYSVPIRDSSTEGECLELAADHLTPRRNDYATRLVRVWQRFVYGCEEVEPAVVYSLCHDFGSLLDRPARGAA